jgi:hypothetical protein
MFPAILENYGLSTKDFSNRQKVELLEYFMRRDMEDILHTFKLEHFLENGYYIRKFTMPANTLTIGKVHKTSHLSFITEGDCTVMTDKVDRLIGPVSFMSPVGVKRAVWCHKNTVWRTYHKTDRKELGDIDELTNTIAYDSDLSWIEQTLLGGIS